MPWPESSKSRSQSWRRATGVDTCGGLVEEKKSRLVQHGAAEGETLLPASGKLRGQAVQIRFEAVELDNFVDAAL